MALPLVWIGGLLASAFVVHEVVKPRLPVYKIEPLLGLPQMKWGDDSQIWLGMPMSVSMSNENFVEIDIFSLVFDMFYMNGDGDLLHLADIKDHNQASSTAATTANTNSNSTKPQALWQIPSRGNFSIDDTLFLSLESTLVWNLLWNSRFYSSLWQGSGSFWLPTTGVAHIKAGAARVPATLKIICDNFVENMVVQGLSCVLHDAQPGWSNLTDAALSLRNHALDKLKANTDGTILKEKVEQPPLKEQDLPNSGVPAEQA
uniref:Uncharacterized protein n=1 Tax=Entomoneis paludosa TaxID=265537 RepID=A0A7S2Y7T0_9STRA|mmetsp:Transcript_21471/g.44791  ORF Transcript_21471/g.44791 Transcript_21471/m.44791 type:complete len:260 (+) Transcript_21471:62-841(+)|eukprot:CAMPEP_0172460164 /NCGR_PEP_ID=MMETSP1065-20121228/35807_1 /TAXON_ID=265537 /ORGANISM="Amphiprora paludosa, Strain CCMP125" /LENGTH=259 /DNA_ID=CAMNT_0013215113 /DNA_START=31 /DNA_END=810 /DNA_ORIENTATION=-